MGGRSSTAPARPAGSPTWRSPGTCRGDRARLSMAHSNWTRRGAPSHRASSTSTRTSTPRSSGTPSSKPSSYHGVTTVVAGNCGFSIAPCRPEHHDVIVRTLENVEGMDADSLAAGIAWDFETFPDYLDLVGRRGTALNFTAYIGHTALRLFVMGDAAYERAATPDEIDRMCRAGGRGDRGRRRRVLHQLLVRAPRGRRQARPEPLRRDGRGRGSVHGRRAGPGRGSCSPHPDGSASTPTSSPGSSVSAVPSPARCSSCRAGSTSRSSSCTRRRCRSWCERLAPGHAPAADHAVHARRRLQPQRRRGLRRADEGRPRGAQGRLP